MTNLALLIYAISIVESSGRCDLSIGDAGELGPLQITPMVIKELGPPWKHKLCRDYDYSSTVFIAYLTKVAPENTNEVWAKVWRKGPSGYKSKTAERYWRKVKEIMRRKENEESS